MRRAKWPLGSGDEHIYSTYRENMHESRSAWKTSCFTGSLRRCSEILCQTEDEIAVDEPVR